uniref:Uncharacterized protein n=1 Tax=Arion vulgaris TaxID=1028688 RepID=A0A0B7AGC0_9EUPU
MIVNTAPNIPAIGVLCMLSLKSFKMRAGVYLFCQTNAARMLIHNQDFLNKTKNKSVLQNTTD